MPTARIRDQSLGFFNRLFRLAGSEGLEDVELAPVVPTVDVGRFIGKTALTRYILSRQITVAGTGSVIYNTRPFTTADWTSMWRTRSGLSFAAADSESWTDGDQEFGIPKNEWFLATHMWVYYTGTASPTQAQWFKRGVINLLPNLNINRQPITPVLKEIDNLMLARVGGPYYLSGMPLLVAPRDYMQLACVVATTASGGDLELTLDGWAGDPSLITSLATTF